MEVQGQYSSCFSLCRDFSQTISSQEIKHANLSIHTAGDDTEVDESQRFNLPAETLLLVTNGYRQEQATRYAKVKKKANWRHCSSKGFLLTLGG